jgi:GNAT superfamily N-acetyltransferase
LLQQAIEFCRDAGHKTVFLWTFEGLEAARTLYEQAGFKLCEAHQIQQWGQTINEQKFKLIL